MINNAIVARAIVGSAARVRGIVISNSAVVERTVKNSTAIFRHGVACQYAVLHRAEVSSPTTVSGILSKQAIVEIPPASATTVTECHVGM